MVRSILSAISKNGLECGTHSNFDQAQLKYILEEELNRFSSAEFKVLDDGTITMLPPGHKPAPDVADLSEQLEQELATEELPGPVPGESVSEPSRPVDQQKTVDSAIVIKDCFRDVTREEVDQVRAWIADFEKRGSI